jgi:hypothetical protein
VRSRHIKDKLIDIDVIAPLAVVCDRDVLGHMSKLETSHSSTLRGVELERIEALRLSRSENETEWARRKTFDAHVRIQLKIASRRLYIRGSSLVRPNGVDSSHKLDMGDWI